MPTLPSLPSVKVPKKWNGLGSKKPLSESYGEQSPSAVDEDDAEQKSEGPKKGKRESMLSWKNMKGSRKIQEDVFDVQSSRFRSSKAEQQPQSSSSASSTPPPSSMKKQKEGTPESGSLYGEGKQNNKYMPNLKMPKLPSRDSFRKDDCRDRSRKYSSDDIIKSSERYGSALSKRGMTRPKRTPFGRSESYSYSLNLSSTDELNGGGKADVYEVDVGKDGSRPRPLKPPALARSRTSPALPPRPSQRGSDYQEPTTTTSKNGSVHSQGTKLTIDRFFLESSHVKETSYDSRMMADENTLVTNHSPTSGVPEIIWQKSDQRGAAAATRGEQHRRPDVPKSYPTTWEDFSLADDRRDSLGFVGMHLTGNTASSSSEGGNPFIGSGDELSPVNTGNYRSFSPARSERIGSIGEAWPGGHNTEEQDYEPGDGLLHPRPHNPVISAAAGRVVQR